MVTNDLEIMIAFVWETWSSVLLEIVGEQREAFIFLKNLLEPVVETDM